jgi:type I restriction enzyme S subunit
MMSPKARGGAAQFPYLRNQNVYWDRFDLTSVATMRFDERERQKFKLKPGDLLACEGRHIGRCAVWSGAIDECYYQKALHRLRAKSDRLTTQYMQHFMTLRFCHQDDLISQVRTSTTIPHLPLEQLLVLTVVVPPRAEQDEINERLAALVAREHAEESNMEGLRATKDALMSVLLAGELRVTPDGNTA